MFCHLILFSKVGQSGNFSAPQSYSYLYQYLTLCWFQLWSEKYLGKLDSKDIYCVSQIILWKGRRSRDYIWLTLSRLLISISTFQNTSLSNIASRRESDRKQILQGPKNRGYREYFFSYKRVLPFEQSSVLYIGAMSCTWTMLPCISRAMIHWLMRCNASFRRKISKKDLLIIWWANCITLGKGSVEKD